ncbi:MAG TPA: hypothetical protein VGR45_01555 [Stellaceae bacterium]|nr:hypothetical protein [Stellaceae bacterium]HEV2300633.1 hypothetical protein [Stellaceae bacterium]
MSYRGYVDQITREKIDGWAADLLSPDKAIDVVILLNGDKMACIPCDELRDDLAELGIYGNGRHGFSYKFTPPLDETRNWGVAIRFADSGQPLARGDVLLQQGPRPPSTVVRATSLVLPAPTDPASLLRILALYEQDVGLYELLCRIDFRGVRPSDLEHCVFGDRGASPVPPGERREQIARDHLNGLLCSAELQENVVAFLLRAFPEKRRLVFIHIPKCAGTGLSSHLAARFPLIAAQWQAASWTTREQLFLNLARFVRETPFSDSIAAAGHLRLSHYAEENLLRPDDQVFTVVRDPLEIAVSALNYMFTRMQAGARDGEIPPDVKDWMAVLDLRDLPPEVTPDFVAEITRRALHMPEIVSPNSLCYWLGGGSAEQVIERLAQYRVEITTTVKYEDWLAAKWGVTTSTRANASTNYVSSSQLSEDDMVFLRSQSSDDRRLYDLIAAAIEDSGKASIFGGDLLRQTRL